MKSIKFEPSKKFRHYGDKVKQISFHPSKPLIMMAHYNGEMSIFNYNTQTLNKKIEVSKKPIRSAIWAGEDWIVTAGDDLKIRVFNFHTTQKLYEFEGHKDFLRKVIFNPVFQYFLTCSDDKSIIRWSLQNDNFVNVFSYEEHKHFVMDIKLQSNNEDIFASSSLDGLIKIWNINSKTSNYSLKGHKAGINCLEFSKGNRQLLASGGDDYSVIIWDLSTRTIMQKIDEHEGNVVDLVFMTSLPFLVSIAEDGKCNFYNTRNFEFCFAQLNFMQKGWSLSAKDNLIACGHDEGGLVLQIGKNQSLASSGKGKLVWSKNNEIYSANLKAVVTKNLRNFEKIDLESKEMGGLEIFPHKILHNDNAQYFCLVDDTDYLIYKSQTYKQVMYGKCKEFVWGPQNKFATLDQHQNLIIQNLNGNQIASLKFEFQIESIYGGNYLGLSSSEFVVFYDWNGEQSMGRIDVETKDLIWENETLIVNTEKSIFVLEVHPELPEEDVFVLKSEIVDSFEKGLFISGLFFYINEAFKLNVIIGNRSFTLSNIGFQASPLEYLDNHERIFFFDSNCQTTSFRISQNLLKLLSALKTPVDDNDETVIERGLALSEEENSFAVSTLQTFEYYQLAFKISKNVSKKIDLAIRLKQLDSCLILCEQIKEPIYWKKIGDLALTEGRFDIAENCFWSCEDLNSLFLLGTCTGNLQMIEKIAKTAQMKKNYSVAYNCYWNSNNSEGCLSVLLESERFGEALIFARSYLPSKIKQIYTNWTNNALSLGNNLLVKKIIRFSSSEEDLSISIDLQTLIETKKVKIPIQSQVEFNAEYKRLDMHQLYEKEGKDAVEQKLNVLINRFEKLGSQNKEEPTVEENTDEGWLETDIPDI